MVVYRTNTKIFEAEHITCIAPSKPDNANSNALIRNNGVCQSNTFSFEKILDVSLLPYVDCVPPFTFAYFRDCFIKFIVARLRRSLFTSPCT